MNNKKSQMLILKIMIAIIILIMAIAFIAPLKENINNNTTSASLNCSSSSLTSEEEATCTVFQFSIFYIIGLMLSIATAFVSGKRDSTSIITAIVIFVIITVLISPLKTLIIWARGADALNCALTTQSVPIMMTCILFDLWLFWFIAIVLSVAVTYIFVKGEILNE